MIEGHRLTAIKRRLEDLIPAVPPSKLRDQLEVLISSSQDTPAALRELNALDVLLSHDPSSRRDSGDRRALRPVAPEGRVAYESGRGVRKGR